VIVFFVDLEVAGELLDLSGEESDLHSWRAGVLGTCGKFLNDVYFGV